MNLTREQMLAEMGITPIWRARETAQAGFPGAQVAAAPAMGAAPAARAVTAQEAIAVDALDWPGLAAAVANCKACQLCGQRRQAVLGVGDLDPDWLFIGEGPGAEEDVRGEPFVGQAGKLLDNMLAALRLARGNKVYIGNAVKCRPPGNRTPEAAEMAACRPWLERQIALLRPRVIVLLGKAAVHSLLHDDKSLSSLRGRRFEYLGIPVIVTYHPAYLLRNLPDKAKAWEDLLFARRCLRESMAAGSAELPF
jgi:DNA polymerase